MPEYSYVWPAVVVLADYACVRLSPGAGRRPGPELARLVSRDPRPWDWPTYPGGAGGTGPRPPAPG